MWLQHLFRRRADAPVAAPPPARRAAWPDLPPVQRVVTAPPLMTDPDRFRTRLASWTDPSFLARPTHLRSSSAPSGAVTGLATPAERWPSVQREAAIGPADPVRGVSSPVEPPVAARLVLRLPAAAAPASSAAFVSAAGAALPPPAPRPAVPLQQAVDPAPARAPRTDQSPSAATASDRVTTSDPRDVQVQPPGLIATPEPAETPEPTAALTPNAHSSPSPGTGSATAPVAPGSAEAPESATPRTMPAVQRETVDDPPLVELPVAADALPPVGLPAAADAPVPGAVPLTGQTLEPTARRRLGLGAPLSDGPWPGPARTPDTGSAAPAVQRLAGAPAAQTPGAGPGPVSPAPRVPAVQRSSGLPSGARSPEPPGVTTGAPAVGWSPGPRSGARDPEASGAAPGLPTAPAAAEPEVARPWDGPEPAGAAGQAAAPPAPAEPGAAAPPPPDGVPTGGPRPEVPEPATAVQSAPALGDAAPLVPVTESTTSAAGGPTGGVSPLVAALQRSAGTPLAAVPSGPGAPEPPSTGSGSPEVPLVPSTRQRLLAHRRGTAAPGTSAPGPTAPGPSRAPGLPGGGTGPVQRRRDPVGAELTDLQRAVGTPASVDEASAHDGASAFEAAPAGDLPVGEAGDRWSGAGSVTGRAGVAPETGTVGEHPVLPGPSVPGVRFPAVPEAPTRGRPAVPSAVQRTLPGSPPAPGRPATAPVVQRRPVPDGGPLPPAAVAPGDHPAGPTGASLVRHDEVDRSDPPGSSVPAQGAPEVPVALVGERPIVLRSITAGRPVESLTPQGRDVPEPGTPPPPGRSDAVPLRADAVPLHVVQRAPLGTATVPPRPTAAPSLPGPAPTAPFRTAAAPAPTPVGGAGPSPEPAALPPLLLSRLATDQAAPEAGTPEGTPAGTGGPAPVPATVVDPAPAATGTPASAGAPPPQPALAGTDLDALVRRLHDPLVRRIKAELRLDRERVGRALDLRH